MVLVVLAAQVVDVSRTHERTSELTSDADDSLVGLLLLGEAVLLHLEVDVLGAEGPDQLVGVRPCVVRATHDQALAEARLQAAGERDHALGMTSDELEIDGRLPALQAVDESGRGELDEVPVADRAGGEQREVKALETTRTAAAVVIHDVGLTAEDRLDPVLATGAEQLDGPVHHAVVGQPERRLVERRSARDEVVDLACAVEQGVLGVDVKVGAGWTHPGTGEDRRPSGRGRRPPIRNPAARGRSSGTAR